MKPVRRAATLRQKLTSVSGLALSSCSTSKQLSAPVSGLPNSTATHIRHKERRKGAILEQLQTMSGLSSKLDTLAATSAKTGRAYRNRAADSQQSSRLRGPAVQDAIAVCEHCLTPRSLGKGLWLGLNAGDNLSIWHLGLHCTVQGAHSLVQHCCEGSGCLQSSSVLSLPSGSVHDLISARQAGPRSYACSANLNAHL